MLSLSPACSVPKDPGQNYLVNTEGDPEWLRAGRESQPIARLLPRIAPQRQPLRNSRMLRVFDQGPKRALGAAQDL